MTTSHINKELNDMLATFAIFVKDSVLNYNFTDKEISLSEFILLELYLKKGIKKTSIGTDLYILNYCKKHPKYDKCDLLTRLFRHIVIDTNTFSIVNIGIPKSLPFEKIDMEIFKYLHFQEFYDGTMIMYNYGLSTDERLNQNNNQNNNNENKESNKESNKDIKLLTKKNIGGANYYNSNITFGDMFKELTKDMNLDMNYYNVSYVFNMYYKNEHIVKDNGINLINVYFYKDKSIQLDTWQSIINNLQNTANIDFINEQIDKHFNMMVQTGNDISDALMKIKPNNLYFNTVDELNTYIRDMEGYKCGVAIYDNYGTRYKLFGTKYLELKELAGLHSRNIAPNNNQNLFIHWLNLKKQNKVMQFIKEFSNEEKNYSDVFQGYDILINNFIYTVHSWYIAYRVKKEYKIEEIPYFLKPILYTLHGIYLADNTPITIDIVSRVVNEMNPLGLYNRVFNTII